MFHISNNVAKDERSIVLSEACEGRRLAMPRASVDIAALYAALDRQRQAEGLSWRGLGRELEIPASTFTRLSQGAGPDVDAFAVMLHWLGMPVAAFLNPPPEDVSPETPPLAPVDAIGFQLRSDRGLSPEAAGAIEQVVRVAYQALRSDPGDR
jgi:hypothetical protein